jgi:chemotaxis protein MotB
MAKKEKPEIIIVEGVPEWLVVFGDRMSLLLTFFILLFSTAELKDPGKIYDLVQTFVAPLDTKRPVYGYTLPRIEMGPDGMLNVMQDQPGEMGETGSSSNHVLNPDGEGVHARTLRDNLHLELSSKVTFRAGEQFLLADARRVLKEYFIPSLVGGRFKVVIRGHTAPEEGSSPAQHRLLSYGRAKAIQEYLIANGIPQKRFEIQAAGISAPINADGDQQVAAEQHRRAEILISPPTAI